MTVHVCPNCDHEVKLPHDCPSEKPMTDTRKPARPSFEDAGTEWWVPRYDLQASCSKWKGKPLRWSSIDTAVYDGWKTYNVGKDIFDSEAEAARRGRELRAKKRGSLLKQIAKLDALESKKS